MGSVYRIIKLKDETSYLFEIRGDLNVITSFFVEISKLLPIQPFEISTYLKKLSTNGEFIFTIPFINQKVKISIDKRGVYETANQE